MVNIACSRENEAYLNGLQKEADRCYSIGNTARSRGFDPELTTETPQTFDIASRVERLLKDYDISNVAELIRNLSKKHDRETVSILVAKEVALRQPVPKDKAIERAVRVGLAILTEGILVAPLEGLAEVKIKKNSDGGSFVDLHYAGPIRSAGGTAQALSVLIADIVRRELDIDIYKPTQQEVDRLKEEIPLYKQVQHLQYTPSNEEIELIARNCPVCINGESTEEVEISGHRDLPRIETNRLRGGACLVISDGLCLKAPKVQKHVKRLRINGWEFMEGSLRNKNSETSEVDEEEFTVDPSDKFIQNILAGRPVLCHPSRQGGFRLRYGRTRATGLATIALHPATMAILDDFIAVGTQIKTERPGKAAAVTPCNTIEGPLVLLKNGDLVALKDSRDARKFNSQIKSIVDLGEILISYGEFLENNHVLIPGAYSEEWYRDDLRRALKSVPKNWKELSFPEAVSVSLEHDIPLHPRFNLFWHDLSSEDILSLRDHVESHGKVSDGVLRIPINEKIKDSLVVLGVTHKMDGQVAIVDYYCLPLVRCLGLDVKDSRIVRVRDSDSKDSLSLVSILAGFAVKARGPSRIGARMGRPEKAAPRKMRPAPHALFPIGKEGGQQRLLKDALSKDTIEVEVGLRVCEKCGKRWFLPRCPCGGHTLPRESKIHQRIPLREVYDSSVARLNLRGRVLDTKCVQGMISKSKTPEPLEKGLLRTKHNIFVFKDGTIRFDSTNLPLTHFKLKDAGISPEDAVRLGYDKDVLGQPLTSAEQLVEQRVQDIIISKECADYLFRVSQFIDELLEKCYNLPAFYKLERPEDLRGHLVVGLAPHTSGGVLARIIGFTPANACFAHPFFHAAKRRNCDGDEDSLILLLDCLINFSRSFLPEKRGGLMDAPLILITRIDPNEIDKEAHNIDMLREYSQDFYEATMKFTQPKDIEHIMDTVGSRIGSVLQYEGFGFTHDVDALAEAPLVSANGQGGMEEKLEAQLNLASKIRAVDASDVVSRIVLHHFLPDLIGNLKAFSSQSVRCTTCNAKYRRMPLKGRCVSTGRGNRECGGNLVLTVHKSSVSKYLEISKRIAVEYGISNYLRQRLDLADEAIISLFSNEKTRSPKLDDFL